ncbi:MAG: carboxypeptidase regulatory-like domain-containing protein, partial [Gemmatimonadaceae bacterium]
MRWTPLLALPALLLALPPARAQGAGRLVGVVTESPAGQPVSDVNVNVIGTRLGAHTGADGRYAISGVAPGR